MANYTFTVEQGSSRQFTLFVFGLSPDLSGKLFCNGQETPSTITTTSNYITVAIPSSISSVLPANYRIDVSDDEWETSKTVVRGKIYLHATAQDEPDEPPVSGEYATLDADGDVINGRGEKIRPVVILDQDDELPDTTTDNTLVVRVLP